MIIDIDFPAVGPDGIAYLQWGPRKCTLRLTDAQGTDPAVVRLESNAAVPLSFLSTPAADPADTLDVTLAQDGSGTDVWIAGKFGNASTNPSDSGFRIVDVSDGSELASQPAMVRIRKNADLMQDGERDRFLEAFGTLNGAGTGRFTDFRDMHRNNTAAEAHGDAGFLPWHRSYLLDLERELQAIDPSVTLPYWRFDQPAPNMFTRAFMGLPDILGNLEFDPGHPFQGWVTDGQVGIVRRMSFAPNQRPSVVISESDTLVLNPFPGDSKYDNFRAMEGNPHGRAHTRFPFPSPVSRIDTAARDPLFFMLHANVDRLWAKWQWSNGLYDANDNDTFTPSANNRVGHRTNDTMWPWNQVTGFPRPSTAPGGNLAVSPVTTAPGLMPEVRDLVDYQAVLGGDPLGFDYDDVPFEVPV